MSQIEKLIARLNAKPAPNDFTMSEVLKLANYYECIIKTGGNHQIRIADVKSGTIIPIPQHGKHISEVYIVELKNLFAEIEARRKEETK